jgi:hypothetical protein
MRTASVLVTLAFLVPAGSRGADPQNEARAIVQRAIEAHGGAATLAKARAHAWKVKGKMMAAGQSMTYTADYTFQSPDQFRFDLDMVIGTMNVKLAAATDGKVAWEQMPPEVRAMTREKQEEFHHTVYVMYLSQVTPLLDKAITLAPLGESKLGDRTVVGVKAAQPGRRDVSLFFDKQTGLLAKTSSRVIDEFTMKEVTQDTFLTGYRDRGGVKVFDRLTIQRDGKDFIIEEMSDQRMLEKVDPKQFARPAADK